MAKNYFVMHHLKDFHRNNYISHTSYFLEREILPALLGDIQNLKKLIKA